MTTMTLLKSFVLLLAQLSSTASARQLQDQSLTAVCGNCWCVPEGGTNSGTCPTDTTGIWQSFPDSYPTLFSTFTETSTPITLQASDGSSDCFPFADSIGALTYDASKFPACVLSTGSDANSATGAVCAYKFASPASDTSDCPSREYELTTYDAADSASADGALMIHSGACGVCSSAQDLGVRMSTLDTLQSKSITCATQFAFGGTFDNLVACYKTVGFTTQCATLWAHFAASNAELCAGSCAGQTDNLSGDPPFCELGGCLTCSEDFQAEFDALAGLYKSPTNAGFTGDIAYPCSSFTRIDTFDPCFSGPAAETTSPAPTSTPQPTSAETLAPAPTPTSTTTAPIADGSGSTRLISFSGVFLLGLAAAGALV